MTPSLPSSSGVPGERGTSGTVADLPSDVVQAFRTGDVAALAAVYDRWSKPVWSVAVSVLGDPGLAEDATQETFLRAWRAASGYDPDRPLGPWLFTIARRTAIDVHRREARPTQGGHAEEQEAASAGVEFALERAWDTWQVRAALAELPPEERDVLRMSHFEELTHREIAEALDVPVGTVKSRSHRAHRRLAGRLAHLLAGGDA
ncbi:MAG TPA: sigma-70 family RNA polymerase sigma factor [Kineosporiaceae bacterium]